MALKCFAKEYCSYMATVATSLTRKARRSSARTNCAIWSPGSAKRDAGLYAQPLERQRRRAKAGERGLDHVESGERRQQQPIRSVKLSEREAYQYNPTGKGEHRSVQSHFILLVWVFRVARVAIMDGGEQGKLKTGWIASGLFQLRQVDHRGSTLWFICGSHSV